MCIAGTPEANWKNDFPHVTYKQHWMTRYCWWYHVVALIWISEFIVACQQFVIGGVVAEWYFNRSVYGSLCK